MKIYNRAYKWAITGMLLLVIFGCKKDVIIPPTPQEETIKFDVIPFINDAIYKFQSDSLEITIGVTSVLPTTGINYSVKVTQIEGNIVTFERELSSTIKNNTIKIGGFKVYKTYNINIKATSKSKLDNQLLKSFTAKRERVYKNYLKTSYELSNGELWFSSDDVYSNGIKYIINNPLLDMQSCQLDINGDGLEDLFYYESYDYNIHETTPNPPPAVFINDGRKLNRIVWNGPNLKNPHGVKVLVGDFNNDSIPDLFSLVAVDQPNGVFPTLKDFNNLLLNSQNGFNKATEFEDQLGFWYAGCSGDIDRDGDLDVIMFNFHFLSNGVTSKILWNDGKGNFTYDDKGIGTLAVVDDSELIDINNDGFLDLVVDYLTFLPDRLPNVAVLWGDGRGFNLNNSTSFLLNSDQFLHDLDFADIDSDKIQEIILSGYDNKNIKFWIEIFKSEDKGKTFVKRTSDCIDNYITYQRYDHLRVRDVDNNGKLDIYAPDKKSNIRWEWNGTKFVKK